MDDRGDYHPGRHESQSMQTRVFRSSQQVVLELREMSAQKRVVLALGADRGRFAMAWVDDDVIGQGKQFLMN